MKVKDLVNKIGDFGTCPKIYIQRGSSILGGGNPHDIAERFGTMKVESFIVPGRGVIKIFVS